MISPLVSIVIPAHNAAATITDQLDALRRAGERGPAHEILVIDNRSTDDTGALVRRWADSTGVPVRVVPASDKAGEPYARNVGLNVANGEFVCYCDADDVVSPNWLTGMTRGFEAADYVTGPIDMATLNESWIANVRGTSVTHGQSTLEGRIPYAHGCNMGFRASTLRSVGGFDERYLVACDLDIAVRMWERGHELAFVSEAEIAYRLRPSLRATYDQAVSYGRYRVPIRRQLADRGIDVGKPLLSNARRLLWLIRHVLAAIRSPETQARWVWVAGQLMGEFRGQRLWIHP